MAEVAAPSLRVSSRLRDAQQRGAEIGEERAKLKGDIQTAQNLIERCLQQYMPQTEVIQTLQAQAKIEPGFTRLVWQKLEEQNADFFRAYHLKLQLKEHVVMFNHLLEQQQAMMNKLHHSWMQTAPGMQGPGMPGAQPCPGGSANGTGSAPGSTTTGGVLDGLDSGLPTTDSAQLPNAGAAGMLTGEQPSGAFNLCPLDPTALLGLDDMHLLSRAEHSGAHERSGQGHPTGSSSAAAAGLQGSGFQRGHDGTALKQEHGEDVEMAELMGSSADDLIEGLVVPGGGEQGGPLMLGPQQLDDHMAHMPQAFFMPSWPGDQEAHGASGPHGSDAAGAVGGGGGPHTPSSPPLGGGASRMGSAALPSSIAPQPGGSLPSRAAGEPQDARANRQHGATDGVSLSGLQGGGLGVDGDAGMDGAMSALGVADEVSAAFGSAAGVGDDHDHDLHAALPRPYSLGELPGLDF